VTRVRPATAGLTLVEMLVVLWVLGILSAIAIPEFWSGLDEWRTSAAARYISGQFYGARFEAVKRSTRVAFRFQWDGVEYRFATFVDGNGNGVRSTEIANGVDWRLTQDTRLSARFGGVRFAIGGDVPLIDGGFGSNPIRVAGGSLVTFGPDGTTSTGSVYIRGTRRAQYAVRVFGVTGRTRVFRFVRGTWTPL
jgi:prepilin-type N-terminal cleavage/methylation domain-containing protein